MGYCCPETGILYSTLPFAGCRPFKLMEPERASMPEGAMKRIMRQAEGIGGGRRERPESPEKDPA